MKYKMITMVILMFLVNQVLHAQVIGFQTKDSHQIFGNCSKGDTDPTRCSLMIEFQWELHDPYDSSKIRSGAVCRHILGVYPYDKTSLIPFGPLFRPRLVIVDPGVLSGVIAEYNVVKNKWQLYHQLEKKWVDAIAFGMSIESNLNKRVTNCQIR